MFSYWAKAEDGLEVSRFLNDDILETMNKFPNHFIGLATVPMQSPSLAIHELERCMNNGFKGVQIGSNMNNKNLNEKEFDEFFEEVKKKKDKRDKENLKLELVQIACLCQRIYEDLI